MDPVTALGIAGNVLQFIDFANELLSSAAEIKDLGSTASTRQLMTRTQDLEVLAQKLSTISITDGVSRPTEDDIKLCEIASYCAKLAAELNRGLSKISGLPGQSRSVTVRQALRTIWEKKKITSLEHKLDEYQKQLALRIAVMMKQDIEILKHRENKRASETNSNTKIIINAILSGQTTTASNLYDVVMELRRQYEDSETKAEKRHKEAMLAIGQSMATNSNPVDSTSNLSEICTSFDEETYALRIVEFLIESLRFERMTYREEDVAIAHPDTFQWALDGDWEHKRIWNNFTVWLTGDSRHYWINGKAGSGKSTLMKFIIEDTRTIRALKKWAGDNDHLVIASFYLWRSGLAFQKSSLGLYRKILSEILSQQPDAARSLFPDFMNAAWRAVRTKLRYSKVEPNDVWRHLTDPLEADIQRAFQKLLKKGIAGSKVCLFIDGVDELERDHEPLLQILLAAKSPSIKIVASSRPISECEEAFKHCQKLRLQDLTRDDMLRYVEDKFRQHPRIEQLDMNTIESLTHDIVNKATGVFLWVVLVVKSLLTGFRNCDTIQQLHARLEAYPPELDGLYRQMFGDMSPFYREQASQILQIFSTSIDLAKDLGAYQLYWATLPDQRKSITMPIQEITINNLKSYQKIAKIKLSSRCCGLLEIDRRHTVTFLHRTVMDFLHDNRVREDILKMNLDTSFNPTVSLMSSALAIIKIAPPLKFRDSDNKHGDELSSKTEHFFHWMAAAERSTQKAQIDYHEALDRTVHQYWKFNTLDGSGRPEMRFVHQFDFEAIFELAVQRKLNFFVESYLEVNPGRVSDWDGHKMLIDIIRDSVTQGEESHFPEKKSLDVQLFEILLRAGADPFSQNHGQESGFLYFTSAWDYAQIENLTVFLECIERHRSEMEIGMAR